MNKQQKYLDQLIAWTLIAYAIGFVVGDFLSDEQYRGDKKRERTIPGPSSYYFIEHTLPAAKKRRVKRLDRMFFAEITRPPAPVATRAARS